MSDLAWVEIGAAGLPVRIFKSFKAATHLVARRIAFSTAQMDRSQAVGIIRHTTFVRSLGDCELCGEHYVRLVNRTCARCRDKYKLP